VPVPGGSEWRTRRCARGPCRERWPNILVWMRELAMSRALAKHPRMDARARCRRARPGGIASGRAGGIGSATAALHADGAWSPLPGIPGERAFMTTPFMPPRRAPWRSTARSGTCSASSHVTTCHVCTPGKVARGRCRVGPWKGCPRACAGVAGRWRAGLLGSQRLQWSQPWGALRTTRHHVPMCVAGWLRGSSYGRGVVVRRASRRAAS